MYTKIARLHKKQRESAALPRVMREIWIIWNIEEILTEVKERIALAVCHINDLQLLKCRNMVGLVYCRDLNCLSSQVAECPWSNVGFGKYVNLHLHGYEYVLSVDFSNDLVTI